MDTILQYQLFNSINLITENITNQYLKYSKNVTKKQIQSFIRTNYPQTNAHLLVSKQRREYSPTTFYTLKICLE